MQRIFLYEFLTGGGCWSLDAAPPAGSLLAEGMAMRDALAADLAAIAKIEVIYLVHDLRLPAPRFHCKQEVRAIRNSNDEIHMFAELARAKTPGILIAPEFSGALFARAEEYQRFGGTLMSPDSRVTEICSEKQWTCTHLAKHGIRTPPGSCFLRSKRQFEARLMPAVLKPNNGCGSQGVQMIESAEELAAVDLWSAEVWRLEQFQPGTHVSASVLTGPLGVLPLQPCTQRLSDDGRFSYLGGATPVPEHLSERAQRLAKSAAETLLPCRGYLGIDMVLGSAENGSQDVVIEINPRLTTSYLILRQACEQNLAEAMLKWALGEPVELSWRPERFEFSVPATEST